MVRFVYLFNHYILLGYYFHLSTKPQHTGDGFHILNVSLFCSYMLIHIYVDSDFNIPEVKKNNDKC